MSDLLRPGTAPHYSDKPHLDIRIRNGAVWQCECGKRWRLRSEQTGPGSWQGQWERVPALVSWWRRWLS